MNLVKFYTVIAIFLCLNQPILLALLAMLYACLSIANRSKKKNGKDKGK